MQRLASEAMVRGTPLPARYWTMTRWWFWLGVPAFLQDIAITTPDGAAALTPHGIPDREVRDERRAAASELGRHGVQTGDLAHMAGAAAVIAAATIGKAAELISPGTSMAAGAQSRSAGCTDTLVPAFSTGIPNPSSIRSVWSREV